MTSRDAVLVVDDEQAMRDFIRKNLAARGFTVLLAANGLEALALFNTNPVSLIILDVMMPNMDGLETIKRIRQSSEVPIIMLTAMGEERDKVTALDLGADDYLTKPFGIEELIARTRAVMRRAKPLPVSDASAPLRAGDIMLDPSSRRVTVGDEALRLTPMEFALLHYLMIHTGKVLTHRNLLQAVWGAEYGDEAEYLRVYVRRLRQKIEPDPLDPQHLFTEHGIGYRFE